MTDRRRRVLEAVRDRSFHEVTAEEWLAEQRDLVDLKLVRLVWTWEGTSEGTQRIARYELTGAGSEALAGAEELSWFPPPAAPAGPVAIVPADLERRALDAMLAAADADAAYALACRRYREATGDRFLEENRRRFRKVWQRDVVPVMRAHHDADDTVKRLAHELYEARRAASESEAP